MKVYIIEATNAAELRDRVEAWFAMHQGDQINQVSFNGFIAYIIYTLK